MAYMPLNNAIDSLAFPVQIFFAINTDVEIIPENEHKLCQLIMA